MVNGEFYYWGPLLYRNRISKDIISEMLIRGNKSNLDFRPNLAGILEKEKEYSIEDKIFFAQAMSPLLADYRLAYQHYYGSECIENKVFQLEDLWINYMYPGDYNPLHTHTDTLSFVIYLQMPDAIKKEYDNYRSVSNKGSGPGAIHFLYGQNCPEFINARHFFPEEGDIFIFPAGLYHTVAPFKSDVIRISLSGNLSIVENKE